MIKCVHLVLSGCCRFIDKYLISCGGSVRVAAELKWKAPTNPSAGGERLCVKTNVHFYRLWLARWRFHERVITLETPCRDGPRLLEMEDWLMFRFQPLTGHVAAKPLLAVMTHKRPPFQSNMLVLSAPRSVNDAAAPLRYSRDENT